MHLLAGDVGGTKTRLAIFRFAPNGKLTRGDTERYESASFPNLDSVVKTFTAKYNVSFEAACFGIPGPVVNGEAKTTNLPWHLTEKELSRSLGISKIKLINDLAAVAAAIPQFTPDDLETLHPREGRAGEARGSVFAVLAPGTGLGQAFLVRSGDEDVLLSSEGGHSDFAPSSELEIELWGYLHKRFGHVSNERLLCGAGLVNIYEFLRDQGKGEEPRELKELLEKGPAPAVISEGALSKKFEICVTALDLFVSILGAQAGNLVLNLMALGGVYLGGGIPPKILPKLKDGTIIKSYLAKGRMSHLVESAPLHVIKDDHAALLGAATTALAANR